MKHFLSVFAVGLAIGSGHSLYASQPSAAAEQTYSPPSCAFPVPPPITIWVHGTKGTSNRFPFTPLKRFFGCKKGLHKALELDKTWHHHELAHVLSSADAAAYPLEHFYLFGWSGKLSFKRRAHAARELLIDLKKVVSAYKATWGVRPFIRIITHSHGGNVVLNMAKLVLPVGSDDDLVIDELLLLACPVQDSTALYIQKPFFKKIYSLYSRADLLQILDPQGLQSIAATLFSRRRFPVQDNLVQVKLKINGWALSHVDFMLSRFVRLLPTIVHELEQWQVIDPAIIASKRELLIAFNIKKNAVVMIKKKIT
jgi:hypothetical protein